MLLTNPTPTASIGCGASVGSGNTHSFRRPGGTTGLTTGRFCGAVGVFYFIGLASGGAQARRPPASQLHFQPPLSREQCQAGLVLHPAPQALAEQQRDGNRQHVQPDPVPGALVGEKHVEQPEDDGADGRPLDAADNCVSIQ